MKISLRILVVLTLTLVVGFAQTATAGDFSLPGSDDKSHSLADYKDAKAVVVLFIATRCPVSNGFNERMAELANSYESKGIVFLASIPIKWKIWMK